MFSSEGEGAIHLALTRILMMRLQHKDMSIINASSIQHTHIEKKKKVGMVTDQMMQQPLL